MMFHTGKVSTATAGKSDGIDIFGIILQSLMTLQMRLIGTLLRFKIEHYTLML